MEFISAECIKTNIQLSMEWGWIFVIGFIFAEIKWLLLMPSVIKFMGIEPETLSQIIKATSITGNLFQYVGIFWFIKVYLGI